MKTKLDKFIRFALLAPFVTAMVIYGSTKPKPGPNFSFDNTYIGDGGSYATNDTVHVALTRRIMELPIDDCDVIAYMRVRSSNSAADYVMLPTYKFGEYPVDFTVQNATNYNYWFYLDYVPPSPVHTNGVFELRGFEVAGEPRVPNPIFSAGFAQSVPKILPPPAADYIQDGLIAMWDGIENAGWGMHDESADNWTELVSGKVTPTVSKGIFSDSAFKIATANSLNLVSNNFRTQTARTVEISFSDSYESRGNRVYIEDNNGNIGFSLQSNAVGCRLSCNLGNSHQQEVPYSEIALAAPISCHWALAQSSTATVYVNGEARRTANKPMLSFSSIGLGLRTNIQADYYCVRVYSRALTAEEIQHNYKIDKERFDLP